MYAFSHNKFILETNRLRTELDAWKERSRRNIHQVEEQISQLHNQSRGKNCDDENINQFYLQLNL